MALYRFSWVVEDELAAMGAPDGTQNDFEELKKRGVGALVSLTENPVLENGAEKNGFPYLHLPVPDMQSPTQAQIDTFIEFCRENADEGRPVAVHCIAGIGRTGTMAACYLVSKGMGAREAINEVRRERPRSIETTAQEGAVYSYAERMSNASS